MKRSAITRMTAAAAFVLCAAAQAQTYPSKPIRLVVGFPPGGSNDIVARLIAPKLTQLLGAQIVVENRPGANATIGTDFVAKAAPDGYTLTLGSASPLAISPFTYPSIPYDTLRDFAAITTVASTPEMLGIHPSLPARNLKELVALAKSQPGKLNFASSGNGGLPHLAIELFKKIGGANVVHVPYKGAAPALTDLLGGHVHMIFVGVPSVLPHMQGGRIRGIAIGSLKRFPAVPELPTFDEQGVKGYEATTWFGLLAPAKTPKDIIAKLNVEVDKAIKSADIQKRFVNDGLEPIGGSPESFGAFIRAEIDKYAKVIKAAGVQKQ